jgi:hypothetical protein
MTDDQVHQPNHLGHEENEGEYGETQQRMRSHFAADVLIEKAHLVGREILARQVGVEGRVISRWVMTEAVLCPARVDCRTSELGIYGV